MHRHTYALIPTAAMYQTGMQQTPNKTIIQSQRVSGPRVSQRLLSSPLRPAGAGSSFRTLSTLSGSLRWSWGWSWRWSRTLRSWLGVWTNTVPWVGTAVGLGVERTGLSNTDGLENSWAGDGHGWRAAVSKSGHESRAGGSGICSGDAERESGETDLLNEVAELVLVETHEPVGGLLDLMWSF